jgi:hypothetical protein
MKGEVILMVEIIVKTVDSFGNEQIRPFYNRDIFQRFVQNTSHTVHIISVNGVKTAAF